MSAWRQRVDDLLFEGEEVEAELEVGTAHLVVTSHRLLAFTPTQDGEDFRQVDRPNVGAVERRGVDRVDLRERAAKAGVAGVLFAGLGWVLDLERVMDRPELSGVEGAGAAGGIGEVLGLAQGLLGLFFALDDALLTGGALLVLVAVALYGTQLALRERKLAVDVAGDDPVLLPDDATETQLDRLRAALAPLDPEDGSASDGDRAPRSDERPAPDVDAAVVEPEE